jgi:hypothetical protein
MPCQAPYGMPNPAGAVGRVSAAVVDVDAADGAVVDAVLVRARDSGP